MKTLAHMEAYLDFPDEHLEVYSDQDLIHKLDQAKEQLKSLIATFAQGELLRDGALVVIVGSPNVGKSSLLNQLLGRDRAIVSEISGTTRDTLEESVDLNGCLIRLVDTAGLSQSTDALECAGMERTKRYLKDGDLFIWVVDGSAGVTQGDRDILSLLEQKKVIAAVNKSDLYSCTNLVELQELVPGRPILVLSCRTGEGIQDLKNLLGKLILKDDLSSESILVTRLRHKRALENSLKSLRRSLRALAKAESLEFVTVDLRGALDHLREMVGEIYSEDLLDVIFSEFCIGK